MTLKEIFDQLTFGELSQLSIGGGELGAISEANYPRVIPHVNLALTALYKRFYLKEGRLSLQPVPNQVVYLITSKYAQSNTRSNALVKYLYDDPTTPFKDDILKIEEVLTDSGYALPLNDKGDTYNASTPTPAALRLHPDIVNQVLELPDYYKTEKLELVYRANHPKIVQTLGLFDPSRIQVQLPDTHMEPLLLFIAARMMTPIGVGQLEGFSHTTLISRYEAACQLIENSNLQIDKGSQTDKLHKKGWV